MTDTTEELVARLNHAMATMTNDDLSAPRTDKRKRFVERMVAMRDRVDALEALTAELAEARAELASGSFYKEADIDRLMDERDEARAEVERLKKALSVEPSDEMIANACLWFRHDFGLLDEGCQAEWLAVAREWWRAFGKEIIARATLKGDDT